MTHYFVGNRVYFCHKDQYIFRKSKINITFFYQCEETLFKYQLFNNILPKIKWSFSAKAKKSSLHIHSDKYGSHRYDIYSTSNNKSIETVVSLNAFRGVFIIIPLPTK